MIKEQEPYEPFLNALGVPSLEQNTSGAYQENNTPYKQAAACMDDFMTELARNSALQAVSTGFPALDQQLGGGLYPGLYALGAISNLGKTTFMMQIADSIAEHGTDVLVFSLEMSKTELMAKSISRIMYEGYAQKANARSIMNGAYLNDETFLEALETYKSTTAQHLFIYEGDGHTTATDVRNTVDRIISHRNSKPVVFIDFLQLLQPEDKKTPDAKLMMDRAVYTLKLLNRTYDLPIMFVSSFNRASYNSAGSLASFKESGMIEYISTNVLTLDYTAAVKNAEAANVAPKGGESKFAEYQRQQEKWKNENEITLQILKSRFGKSGGRIQYTLNGECSFFQEIADETRDLYSNVNAVRVK